MALSKTEIDAVLGEVDPLVTGGWIQKVYQPTPTGITLEIRAHGRTITLFLSADSSTARFHLTRQRLPNPPVPPPFCQFLRAHLQGSRVQGIERMGEDRVVRISLAGREGFWSLIAALTGRSADIVVTDAEGKILNSLKHGREKAGQLYAPPAPPSLQESRVELQEQKEPSEREDGSPFPISHAIEQRYQEREQELARQRIRQVRMSQIRKGLKRIARRVKALTDDLAKADRYREYARYGELLKANLGQMSKGHSSVTVVDYFDPALPELVIPLDPAKSPRGNMDDYFKKYRKYILAEREVRPRVTQAEEELAALRQELRAVEHGTWQPPADRLAHGRTQPPSTSGPPRSKQAKGQARTVPFRRFVSSDGLPIYVGRNARENEELTHRFAHGDDLWLHSRGSPGSHVVVRLEKGADPPSETIRDAAILALLYSDLKKSGKGEVVYTRKKWVRKVKGKPAGTVTVTREKSIFLTLDKARLAAIKERSRVDNPASPSASSHTPSSYRQPARTGHPRRR